MKEVLFIIGVLMLTYGSLKYITNMINFIVGGKTTENLYNWSLISAGICLIKFFS